LALLRRHLRRLRYLRRLRRGLLAAHHKKRHAADGCQQQHDEDGDGGVHALAPLVLEVSVAHICSFP
jgi:hypothetical protein